ncbi:zinc finger SWIM domain-containing protein 7 isoform X3 [Chiloscyllium plagiosum]|uniref:zinc finger SWIM domain-containing protein 7 isoform X3 n=1 Tax=Chiloscyllium plagiosum TaxID=36176 RepID=UPI001CB87FDD|nr:zinc finger SWIM domain-containing protein 7 isoform X3 [Chiloscyllium plagiosum]
MLTSGTLPVVAEELLKKVKQVYQELSQLTDDLLLALKFVFGPAALHALELVDRRSVTLIQSPSGRSLYQVEGSSGQVYYCLCSCLYCSCPAFMYSVLRRNDNIMNVGISQAYI